MKIEISLKDFIDSFISKDYFEDRYGLTSVSIYENEKLLIDCESVNKILSDHKNILDRKVSYVDVDRWNDIAWLMISIK